MNQIQNDLNLLPRKINKIAFGIMLCTVLFVVLSISKVIVIDKMIVEQISSSTFLLSLLILSMTRSKIEDELTIKIRLKAYTASFVFGVVITIIQPLINLIFSDSFVSDKGVIELLISMFLFYFFMTFIMKKNR